MHLKWCISINSQVAHFVGQIGIEHPGKCNPRAITWGFQQLSPRYGVLTLDALLSTSVQLAQLARRNLLPGKGLQRFRGSATQRINQPPLAIAPRVSSGFAYADRRTPVKDEAQRDCPDVGMGTTSGWKIFRSPGLHGTEMTSNCNPWRNAVRCNDATAMVSASTIDHRYSLLVLQGVSSC